ncbi:MAG TPA: GNAT family N-acetyltransferase, partial [Verrucomicrobiales bacterium]|nr:GNAT family N-acetyltransferase [Verrucomicrobiales bacterium]
MPPESTSPVLEIRIDDLRGPEVAALLREHLDEMAQYSPPESRHALDLEGLRHPAVVFWTAWENGSLVGCAALKRLDDGHAEIKSMRTAVAHQRRGIAGRLLEHVIAEVRRRGFRR